MNGWQKKKIKQNEALSVFHYFNSFTNKGECISEVWETGDKYNVDNIQSI